MCGITVIVSKKEQNIIQNLLDSLNIIQNRGYDSVGVSIYEEKWNIYKSTCSNRFTWINNFNDFGSYC